MSSRGGQEINWFGIFQYLKGEPYYFTHDEILDLTLWEVGALMG